MTKARIQAIAIMQPHRPNAELSHYPTTGNVIRGFYLVGCDVLFKRENRIDSSIIIGRVSLRFSFILIANPKRRRSYNDVIPSGDSWL